MKLYLMGVRDGRVNTDIRCNNVLRYTSPEPFSYYRDNNWDI